jgi:hypothetical protein
MRNSRQREQAEEEEEPRAVKKERGIVLRAAVFLNRRK